MKKRTLFIGLGLTATLGIGAAAYVASPTVHSGNPGESPELGGFGEYALGTVVKEFPLEGREIITGWGAITGNLKPTERVLPVRFWYPATVDANRPAVRYTHTMEAMRVSGNEPMTVVSQGIAVADATPVTDKQFPFVLMSHGYGGWSTQFSNLAEHIASKGYIVASIDHLDQFASGVTSAILSFGNVLLGRTQDQRQVLSLILADAEKGDQAYARQIDQSKVGLIGYSMGGYGAISTSGAPYSFEKDPLASLPESAQQVLKDTALETAPVQALVTFAPWGAQPDSRVWDESALSNIDIPVLLVSGNQDDIVNFDEGVRWLFDNLSSAERHLLVYREARHNIVGNHFDIPQDAPFAALESLKEPVWRSDRLNAINQHFVSAFLDSNLKGDPSKASYLTVPTTDSNAGEWPTSFGEQLNGRWAGEEQTSHWKGFQKRWAVGLELHHATAE
ncbi:MAG: dienelactone hydrolase family protein [Pseudomonadota bacterium]